MNTFKINLRYTITRIKVAWLHYKQRKQYKAYLALMETLHGYQETSGH